MHFEGVQPRPEFASGSWKRKETRLSLESQKEHRPVGILILAEQNGFRASDLQSDKIICYSSKSKLRCLAHWVLISRQSMNV